MGAGVVVYLSILSHATLLHRIMDQFDLPAQYSQVDQLPKAGMHMEIWPLVVCLVEFFQKNQILIIFPIHTKEGLDLHMFFSFQQAKVAMQVP